MKFSKKILALLLSILIALLCLPLSGAAQTINEKSMSAKGAEVIRSFDDLQDGKTYRLRNADTGKYLSADYPTVYQHEDASYFQEIVIEKYAGNAFRMKGALWGTYITPAQQSYVNYLTTLNDSWRMMYATWYVESVNADGGMLIYSSNFYMRGSEPEPVYISAMGDENGSNGMYSGYGNIRLVPLNYSETYHSLWYFEEVK